MLIVTHTHHHLFKSWSNYIKSILLNPSQSCGSHSHSHAGWPFLDKFTCVHSGLTPRSLSVPVPLKHIFAAWRFTRSNLTLHASPHQLMVWRGMKGGWGGWGGVRMGGCAHAVMDGHWNWVSPCTVSPFPGETALVNRQLTTTVFRDFVCFFWAMV